MRERQSMLRVVGVVVHGQLMLGVPSLFTIAKFVMEKLEQCFDIGKRAQLAS